MNQSRNPEELLRQAGQLRESGRVDEAIRAYLQVLSRWPGFPNSWYNLAKLFDQTRQFDAALEAYQRALNLGAPSPEEIHINRGVIFQSNLLDSASAEKEYQAALAISPNLVSAYFNLGSLEEERGNRVQASAYFERVLELSPAHHEALARYAKIQKVQSPDDPVMTRLRVAVADEAAPLLPRASAAFSLGDQLNNCTAYDDAFVAYQTANRLSRESAGAAFKPYDRKFAEGYFDELIDVFGQRPPPSSGPNHAFPVIFICGMFRSGSTLTEQVLAAHPRVVSGGELDLLPNIAVHGFAPYPQAVRRASPAQIKQQGFHYLQQISRLFPGADFVTDKRPDNFLNIGLIKTLFPEAKIINTMRHPLDICLSIYFQHIAQGVAYALDLSDIAHYYTQYRRLMDHWKTLFPNDIFDFEYEAFVRDPKRRTESLLAFCGLEWDDACLSFHNSSNVVKTASLWQVRQPLYDKSTGRWRHYSKHLDGLREYLSAYIPDDDNPDRHKRLD